ncbi:lysoplasmalogenase [Chloracidobacterium sp. MS 40/45]|uniref:lysoplasmalogenase n=1 Tax=Chloracidobacterium aggregatum TaxID=2851959 RepID=UPI001B8BF25B|nr:lysoplasmalogenase [Chloracidobacterium aggregatum]QUW00735.1 lysoplasmalogenase [Chloracidobacterium sp. MS 40/45]
MAIAYLGTFPWLPYPGSFLPKALPVLVAAGWLLRAARSTSGRRVGYGLIWSALGDVALALDDRFFLVGLTAFLIAHMCYIAAFGPQAQLQRPQVLRAGGVVAYGVVLGAILGGATNWQLPILLYALVLTGMGVTAALRRGSRLVFPGALAFMVSDSLLAWNRFLMPLPLAHLWVMLTYYLAQGLITGGMLDDQMLKGSEGYPDS